MKFNKILIGLLFILLFLPVFTHAQFTVDGPGETGNNLFTGTLDILKNVGQLVSEFFAMDWLFGQNPEYIFGFMRFLIWLTVFTIIHVAGQNTVAPMFEQGGRRLVIIMAIVIATLTTIFIPFNLILSWGQVVAAIMMIILIGVPIGYLMWIAYSPDVLPSWFGETGWMIRIVRIVIILIAWQITHLVGVWGIQLATSLGGYTGSNQFVSLFVLA